MTGPRGDGSGRRLFALTVGTRRVTGVAIAGAGLRYNRNVVRRALGLAVWTSLAVAACSGDKAEYLTVTGSLAVGAYAQMLFGDACPGSKADLCSRETVQSIDAFTVDPPGALEILAVADIPPELYVDPAATYAVHGLAPAQATVCVKAHYSDGTDRNACQPVEVGAIARIATQLYCDPAVGSAAWGPLVWAGATLRFDVELLAADGSALGGTILHPIDETQLVVISPLSYAWQSPTAGGALTLSSPLDPTFAEKLETYGPAQVDAVFAGADLFPPTILGPGKQQPIQLAVDVGGVRACMGLPASARSDTPAVCLGPNGEETWAELGGSATSFTAVTEGTCQLSVGVAGGTGYPGTITVPYYFVNATDQARDATIRQLLRASGLPDLRGDAAGDPRLHGAKKMGRRLELQRRALRLHGTDRQLHRPARLRRLPLSGRPGGRSGRVDCRAMPSVVRRRISVAASRAVIIVASGAFALTSSASPARAAGGGTIEGTVRLAHPGPPLAPLPVAKDVAVCGRDAKNEAVVVGKGGRFATSSCS